MLYPYSWLKEYLSESDLKKGKWTAEKIGQRIGLSLAEYEGREEISFDMKGVVVGRVLNVYPHQDAVKLSIADVDVGKKKVTIVCGAPNLAKGMLVPVALPGTKLKEDVVIEEMEIRGVKSEGMICAAQELGLEEKSSGILDLGKNLKPGDKLEEVVDFSDEVLEFGITPNIVYADNMIGMAREIAVVTETKFEPARYKLVENSKDKIDDILSVKIQDNDKCKRYSARVMKNVRVGESPLWLKRRLEMVGLRPVNSVVDITNYVMLEMGQPMHAFDYDLIIGEKIIVRNAKDGEALETLDGQKKFLSKDDLVIADEKRPLAIAGIMGGLDSGVVEKTSRIVLEAANFGREFINVSSNNLGLQSDSSIRFGRGLAASKTIEALDRAAYLIQQICGGEVCRGSIDVRSERILHKEVKAKYENINRLLGVQVPTTEVKRILKSLDFEIKKTDSESLTVVVPTYRTDIEYEEDLIEEVGRIFGYEKIDDCVFAMPVIVPRPEKKRRFRNKMIQFLSARGWSEVYSYSFVSGKQTTGWGFDLENAFEIENPIDKKMPYLRQSVLVGLMDKMVSWSAEPNVDKVKIYEWGNVFNQKEEPVEATKMGLVLAEKNQPKEIFLRMKGVVAGILRLGGMDLNEMNWVRGKDAKEEIGWIHPVNSMVVYNQAKQKMGEFGLLHPAVANEWKLNDNIVYAELDLANLVADMGEEYEFVEPSKYPVSWYDVAVVVEADLMSGELLREAKKAGKELLVSVEVFDEYEMENKKSVGLRFGWQSRERTLSDADVERGMKKVLERLNKKFGAQLRDS